MKKYIITLRASAVVRAKNQKDAKAEIESLLADRAEAHDADRVVLDDILATARVSGVGEYDDGEPEPEKGGCMYKHDHEAEPEKCETHD